MLFHGFYSIKVEAIYTLSILGQQVLDVHGRRVHDLPRILLRYGQRAGELAEDAAYPVVAVVVEPFDDGRPTSVTRKDGLRIFVVHLLVDVRDVEEEILHQIAAELRHLRNRKALHVRFHRFHPFALDLVIDGQQTLVAERMRLYDIDPIGIQLVQDAPQLTVHDRRIVGPTDAFRLFVLFELLDFQVGQLVFAVLVIGEPRSDNSSEGTDDCGEVFHSDFKG